MVSERASPRRSLVDSKGPTLTSLMSFSWSRVYRRPGLWMPSARFISINSMKRHDPVAFQTCTKTAKLAPAPHCRNSAAHKLARSSPWTSLPPARVGLRMVWSLRSSAGVSKVSPHAKHPGKQYSGGYTPLSAHFPSPTVGLLPCAYHCT
jgi:hypothetical protein